MKVYRKMPNKINKWEQQKRKLNNNFKNTKN